MYDTSQGESDEELIESANKGDLGAFEALYYRYRDWVHQLAWRFTGKEDLALDVLQETFTYLLQKFPGFELTAKMTTFLYPAVKNFSIAACRRNRRYISADEMLCGIPAPQKAQASRADLSTVLACLSLPQREVLLMKFVDQMKLREIATALNISESTAKSRLYRALQTLREDHRTQKYFLE